MHLSQDVKHKILSGVQETDVSCAGVRVDLKRLAQFLHGEQLHPEVPYTVQQNPVLRICKYISLG
jgi:hypothetical protein